MANNSNWKAQLSAIIREHNDGHAVRNKDVSFNTRHARRQGLFRTFTLLRNLGFHVTPANLGARHIAVLMAYWTANPLAGDDSRRGGARLGWPKAPYSAAYIQQQMSFLRAFSGWIKKDGLVKTAESYVDDANLTRRSYCATEDRGWRSHGVDVRAKVEEVRSIDRHVGVQLQMMMAFGLRRKEAVMFSPVAAKPWLRLLWLRAPTVQRVASTRAARQPASRNLGPIRAPPQLPASQFGRAPRLPTCGCQMLAPTRIGCKLRLCSAQKRHTFCAPRLAENARRISS